MPNSSQEFRAALDAITRREQQPAPGSPPLRTVAVLGAGPIGQLLAAEALAAGLEVRLYSAFARELDGLRTRGGITVRGRHLVGTYAVSETSRTAARPAIQMCASIDAAVAGAQLVLVATPATVHPTYAGLLAHALPDDAAIVLMPGRFLGSVEVQQTLLGHGAGRQMLVAEAATAPYLARDTGGQITVDAVAGQLPIAELGGRSKAVADLLRFMLPMATATASVLDIAFGGVTGVIGVAPIVLNLAASQAGDPPLWRDLVTPHLSATILRDLDTERREVAFAYGVRDLPSAASTLAATFGADGSSPAGEDLAQTLAELDAFADYRLSELGGPHLSDDVPNMLVPLASAGRCAQVPTPATDAMIAVASVLTGADYARHGRRLETLGLDGVAAHEMRRYLQTRVAIEPTPTPWRRI